MAARVTWACEDPREIDNWNIGLRLLESRTIVDVPEPLNSRLSLPIRTTFYILRKFFPKQMKVYQLNLYAGQSAS